jgi:hypothetical protein
MQHSRLHLAFLFGLLATLAVTLTASISATSSAADAGPQLSADRMPYEIDSLHIGQSYADAEGALSKLRDQMDKHGQFDPEVIKCLDENADNIVSGRERHPKGHCVKTLKFTTRDLDITVGFVEDYPNHPRQMCVGSIEYDQRGFQDDPRAFATAIPLSFPSLGTPVPQSTPDNNLTTAISNLYFYDAPVCRRENNCFTIADQCKIAPECAEVTADSDSADDTATAYVRIIAKPYVTQQTAYYNVGIEEARERTIPGFNETEPLVGAKVGTCKTYAFLVPPQVKYAVDDGLKKRSLAEIPKPMPPTDPNFPTFRLAACSTWVCLLEYQRTENADKTVEVDAFYRASGEWKPIWVLRGPCPLELSELQDLINHHRPNDGWVESPERPQTRLCSAAG